MAATYDEKMALLAGITAGGTKNFWQGYTYLKDAVATGNGSHDLSYWLEKAAQININADDSTANTFIRSVTKYGLLYDGKNPNVQGASDSIGRNAIGSFLTAGSPPSLQSLISIDVQSATQEAGQTVEGWGGAFYYWNQPFGSASGTVGSSIGINNKGYDKFLTVVSKAVLDVMTKHGLDLSGALEIGYTTIAAQAPSYVKADVTARIYSFLNGENYSLAGDPDWIGPYKIEYREGTDGVWTQGGADITDPVLISDLNLRRNDVLRIQDLEAFNSFGAIEGVDVDLAMDAIGADIEILSSILDEDTNSYISDQSHLAKLAHAAATYSTVLVGESTAPVGSATGLISYNNGGYLEIDVNSSRLNRILGSNRLSDETKDTFREDLIAAATSAIEDAANEDLFFNFEMAFSIAWDHYSDTEALIAASQKIEYYAYEASGGNTVDLKFGKYDGTDMASLLVGGSGSDKLSGGSQDDVLVGGGGNDNLFGGLGKNVLVGGSGNDKIYSQGGINSILGGDGNDTIDASFGFTLASGGDGADTFIVGSKTDILVVFDADPSDRLYIRADAIQSGPIPSGGATQFAIDSTRTEYGLPIIGGDLVGAVGSDGVLFDRSYYNPWHPAAGANFLLHYEGLLFTQPETGKQDLLITVYNIGESEGLLTVQIAEWESGDLGIYAKDLSAVEDYTNNGEYKYLGPLFPLDL